MSLPGTADKGGVDAPMQDDDVRLDGRQPCGGCSGCCRRPSAGHCRIGLFGSFIGPSNSLPQAVPLEIRSFWPWSVAAMRRSQRVQALEHVVQAVSVSVSTSPTSPSAATSEPAEWISRNLHSTVPSCQRTPLRSTGVTLAPAVHVRRDSELDCIRSASRLNERIGRMG